MKERNQIIFKLIASHIFLITFLVSFSLLVRCMGFLLISISQTVGLILLFAGYWEFFGSKFKWIFCSVVEILILLSVWLQLNHESVRPTSALWLSVLAVIQLYLIFELVKIWIAIFRQDADFREIVFPFKSGSFLVTDGGNSKLSRLMNYHFHSPVHKRNNTNQAMLYATDIVKTGNGSFNFLPKQNQDYPVFNEKVYCPMEGFILKVVNSIEDNKPYSGNYPYNTGNTVVVKNGNYYFLLGHLKKGSILVGEGDYVSRNDLLGVAGNSGMSERPHLHMQLMKSNTDDFWKGTGINIQFNGKNLYKNRMIKI
jgi:hypothetical protein